MKNLPLDICGWIWLLWLLYWVFPARSSLKTKKSEALARLQHLVPTLIGLTAIFHAGNLPALSWGALYDHRGLVWLGLPVTLLGHAFSVWARVHLGKYWSGMVALKHDHKLVVTGPYRLVRHPIYTGMLTTTLGCAMAAGTIEAFAGLAIIIAAYIVKGKREEKILLQEFGPAYAAYIRRTKAIVPYIC